MAADAGSAKTRCPRPLWAFVKISARARPGDQRSSRLNSSRAFQASGNRDVFCLQPPASSCCDGQSVPQRRAERVSPSACRECRVERKTERPVRCSSGAIFISWRSACADFSRGGRVLLQCE
jgi:hypothetical protein